jgi:hypothetical protein
MCGIELIIIIVATIGQAFVWARSRHEYRWRDNFLASYNGHWQVPIEMCSTVVISNILRYALVVTILRLPSSHPSEHTLYSK